jgi:2-dehydro-3-deoxyphosphogluconate aldolase/(4S)-4-hydroxy-2-oxoglutarate aldolase
LWIPGCGTLTEIVTAREAGAQLIKVFPGSVLGPKFVSAVLAVVPDLKLMPTGGVAPTAENLKAWFDAGVYCVGVGSQLVTGEIVEGKQWHELENRVSQLFSINYR